MSGISSKAASTALENKKKYNGIEFDEDLGLNIYEAFYRHLDPQTGRWWEIDPKIDAGYESITPYNSMFNDPIRYSDFMGDEAGEGDGWDDFCKDMKSVVKDTWRSVKDIPATVGRVYDDYIKPTGDWINETLNPLTSPVELITGKSYSSGFSENKSRSTSAVEVAITFIPGGKVEGALIKAEIGATEKAVVKTTVGELRTAGEKDAHHIIQDAAVRDLPGYSTAKASGVKLNGPSSLKGSQHYNATQVQKPGSGYIRGTYARERVIAYKGLQAAGFSKEIAKKFVKMADLYFKSIGVMMNTKTRIPKN